MVRTAVTLTCTPASARRPISAPPNSPAVLVTGILTDRPHNAPARTFPRSLREHPRTKWAGLPRSPARPERTRGNRRLPFRISVGIRREAAHQRTGRERRDDAEVRALGTQPTGWTRSPFSGGLGNGRMADDAVPDNRLERLTPHSRACGNRRATSAAGGGTFRRTQILLQERGDYKLRCSGRKSG